MLRARLITNPEARGVGPASGRVLLAALESRFKLESLKTKERGEAIEVAREAADDGYDVVIAFGGDGLVNEVANGVAGSETALAVIPGGTMNVFARNLGLPRDPVEGADRIMKAAERSRYRYISIPSVNGRHFTFACGCGFDAEAAGVLDRQRSAKRILGEPSFYAAALATFLARYRRRSPFLVCDGPFGHERAVGVMALNGGPYAYLLGRPVRPVRRAGAEGTIDAFIIRRLSVVRIPRYGAAALLGLDFGSDFTEAPGIESMTVRAEEPFVVHVDGEVLDPVRSAEFRASSATLKLLV